LPRLDANQFPAVATRSEDSAVKSGKIHCGNRAAGEPLNKLAAKFRYNSVLAL
jgi:hypothetical protein